MEIDDNRTHGAESAINDTVEVPANMTADADHAQHIPGAEAIPADMPNAPHGDMPLTYDLQTFNALVAANTAMESELAARDEALRNKDIIIGDLRERIADLKAEGKSSESVIDRVCKANAQLESDIKEAAVDLKFANDQREVLQRRLDRSLGYLDRVLDDEDSIRTPATQTVPADKPPVGPAIGEIPDAVRPRSTTSAYRDQGISRFMSGASVRSENGRHRRF